MRTLLLILLCTLCLPQCLSARTVRDFFANEPDDVFLLLPRTTRLDMLDNYDAGRTDVITTNRLGTGSKLLEVDDNYLKVNTSEARTVELLLLEFSRRDTIIAVIETVRLPYPDSRLRFYNSHWVPLSSIKPLKKMPTIDDFFLPRANAAKRRELLGRLPFTMLEMTFTGERHHTMSVRHNLSSFLVPEEYADYAPWMRETITYTIDGAKFKVGSIN